MFPLGRFLEIATDLTAFAVWLAAGRAGLIHPAEPPGERLCRVLARLGGTFVKLGQAMSLRRDLFPESFVEALQALQDRVPPFPGSDARKEAERALGERFTAEVEYFDVEPLAAASVAQVHRAKLRDGQRVIVKVRRPGIKRRVSSDLAVLRAALGLLSAVMPRLRRFQPLAILDELETNLWRELDFRNEALRIRQFGDVFRDSPTINVPAVIDDFAAAAAIVMEESGGFRIDDPAVRPHGPVLAQMFIEAFLKQFFEAGVFHADPHPGNLFIMADGRICFHDFGLVGVLDQGTCRALAAFMQAFVFQDPDWLLDAYLQMGLFGEGLDRASVRRGLAAILEDYARLPLRDWSFAQAFVRVFRLAGRGMRLPHELLMLMRAFFLIETTIRTLDPAFNLVDGLLARAPQVAWQAARDRRREAHAARLRYEALLLFEDFPALLVGLIEKVRDLFLPDGKRSEE